MIRSPKFWVLVVLLIGPIAAYVFFGALWLAQKRWLLYGFATWTIAGLLFSYLSVRWTKGKARDAVLPPIDWDSPRTFVEFDKQAWSLVEAEATSGDNLPMTKLTEIDTYLDAGKRMGLRLAAHYHPLSTAPIDNVPVIQLLTALELAAEDLGKLCREVPGGDMITPSFWKKAVQAAGFFQKANQVYGYLLPLFSPATGLARLGTQKLMAEPAWKNMQQNLLRWFYRAYVNRLGVHLIELYSGRLAIGADQYRKLTRRKGSPKVGDEAPPRLTIAVAGALDSGRSTLIAAVAKSVRENLSAVRGRLEADGFEGSLADFLSTAEWVEIPGYAVRAGEETTRDLASRKAALKAAFDSDLVLLTIDGRREDIAPEVKIVAAWDEFFAKNQTSEAPPMVAVLTWIDALGTTAEFDQISSAKEHAVRKALPASVVEVFAVALGSDPPLGLGNRLLVSLAPLLDRAERVAMIRHIQDMSGRSKARRLMGQIGQQGKRLFSSLRAARRRS